MCSRVLPKTISLQAILGVKEAFDYQSRFLRIKVAKLERLRLTRLNCLEDYIEYV